MCVFCQVRIKVFTHKIGLAMQPRGSSSAGASPVTLLAFMLFILARHRSLHWNSKIAQQFLLFNISWRLIDMANCKCDCKRPQYKEQLLLSQLRRVLLPRIKALAELAARPQALEDLLDRAWGLEPNSRLSCQAIVGRENLLVEIPKYTINHAKENH
mgnify:CR=1 FL=1